MPRPKTRTPQLRERVLAAAVDLLGNEGPAGFSTRNVARAAQTSTPAVYELFGDRSGLLREMFFVGLRRLHAELTALEPSSDPRGDLLRLVAAYRRFVRDNPALAALMFSRPFADFDPGPAERNAGAAAADIVVDHVRRCIDAGILHGDPKDIALVLVTLVQGLAAAENARRLGSSQQSIDRRWDLAINAVLDGLGGNPDGPDHGRPT